MKDTRWYKYKSEKLIEMEKLSFEAFLDEIEMSECFEENEQLAKQIIVKLQERYRLLI